MQVIWTNRNGGVSKKVGGMSQTEVNKFLEEQEARLEAEFEVEITELNTAHAEEVAGLNTTIDEKNVEINKLEAEIAELEEITSTFPPNVEEVAY